MSTTDQIPTGSYSNIDVTIDSEGKTRNNRSRNHNNGSRRNNQQVNRAQANFTGEVPSVESVLGTVTEHNSIEDQFKNFQDKVKQYQIHLQTSRARIEHSLSPFSVTNIKGVKEHQSSYGLYFH